ncbi:hypothetical protein ASPACDRAFT_42834 [Aspergillus aculeatus ATCC 16872]|uniref:Carrier domain-containing protein n=1 Tax=Aspergillus aculeatus (strain ATCC 16872 / CBS 172.66 / WB 5094) TaxID=690307 RepID=A0A1L9WVQ8_ASPA1|nr:uncharacterized protein ASPACDRAFT_42834 [Aspergillus aculeatus ATCC 16872]OJK00249.1 hypothetical protein ASPACDRAFT_42834 [Aspergillus aculeatus ATCC 16872]
MTNGKADCRKLEALGSSRTVAEWARLQPAKDKRWAAASSPEELALQRLFAEVLDFDCNLVDTNDSFFSLGGDSIAAMRLSQHARETGLAVTVADIFRNPGLCDLTIFIRDNPTTTTMPTTTYHDPHPFSLLSSRGARSSPRLPNDLAAGITAWTCGAILTSLCTVFIVDHWGRQLQAVLDDNVKPEADVQSTEGDLATACKQAYSDDRLHRPFSLGRSFRRLFIISSTRRRPRTTHHTTVSRPVRRCQSTHHLLSLHDLLPGRALTPTRGLKFAGYIRHMQQRRAAAEPYWRTLLQDPASITADWLQSKTAVPAPPALPGSTPATVFTTLCARTLAQLAGVHDIVLSTVGSGRSSLPSELQHVAGPCVNTIPVRLRIKPEQSLAQQLAAVHTQHIQDLPFETSQLSDIAAHSTDWPVDARDPSLVIQFQNLDTLEQEHDFGTESPGTTSSALAAYQQADRPVDGEFLFILAKPVRGAWELADTASSKVHTQETLDAVLEALCRQVEMTARGTQPPVDEQDRTLRRQRFTLNDCNGLTQIQTTFAVPDRGSIPNELDTEFSYRGDSLIAVEISVCSRFPSGSLEDRGRNQDTYKKLNGDGLIDALKESVA